ncbi:MAG: hypothetical protein JSS09_03610 [Verrucomicrobia bacterium]|nr:hypothetical protein [Verrucomicrobiota bacterium]
MRNTAIISATLGVLCDERINMNPKWVIGFGILGLGSSSVLDIPNDLSLLGPESRLSELKKKKIELISHINDKEQGF